MLLHDYCILSIWCETMNIGTMNNQLVCEDVSPCLVLASRIHWNLFSWNRKPRHNSSKSIVVVPSSRTATPLTRCHHWITDSHCCVKKSYLTDHMHFPVKQDYLLISCLRSTRRIHGCLWIKHFGNSNSHLTFKSAICKNWPSIKFKLMMVGGAAFHLSNC